MKLKSIVFGALTMLSAPLMRTVPSAPSKTPDAFKMPSPSTGNVVGSMPVMCVYSELLLLLVEY